MFFCIAVIQLICKTICHTLTEIYYILFDCDIKRHTMYVIHQIKNNTATQILKEYIKLPNIQQLML